MPPSPGSGNGQGGKRGCPRSQSRALRSVLSGNFSEVAFFLLGCSQGGMGGNWAGVLCLGGQACE